MASPITEQVTRLSVCMEGSLFPETAGSVFPFMTLLLGNSRSPREPSLLLQLTSWLPGLTLHVQCEARLSRAGSVVMRRLEDKGMERGFLLPRPILALPAAVSPEPALPSLVKILTMTFCMCPEKKCDNPNVYNFLLFNSANLQGTFFAKSWTRYRVALSSRRDSMCSLLCNMRIKCTSLELNSPGFGSQISLAALNFSYSYLDYFLVQPSRF